MMDTEPDLRAFMVVMLIDMLERRTEDERKILAAKVSAACQMAEAEPVTTENSEFAGALKALERMISRYPRLKA